MDFGIGSIIQIFGSLAFFIFGMKMMSEGIQRAAGSQLRGFLGNMTKNRVLGVFTGFLITALVQSSSATTVMTVSFVNAGLLSLLESAGVMMGANIGTTITGWLVSFLGFKVKLSAYSIPLFAIGVPMLFMNKGKVKYWGEFIVGFAILFLGLSALKGSVPDIKHNPEVLEWLKSFSNSGIWSRLFFVLVGTILTIVVQSSSAAMAITLTMCAQGWLPFEVSAAMILGENIGTTITAELASIVGNTAAKRSARIHSLFNVIGVTWMVIVLPLFLPVLSSFMMSIGFEDPTSKEGMALGLSAFHTSFNMLNVLIMIGFVPWLVKVATKTVKEKLDEDESNSRLQFISGNIITPELATIELQKETAHFGKVTSKMNGFLEALIQEKDEKKIYFMPEQRQNLLEMIALVSEGFEEMVTNLQVADYASVTKEKAREIEDRINVKRNEMRTRNQDQLGEAGYPVEAAMTYNTIFSSLERVGDHLINVTESVVGEI